MPRLAAAFRHPSGALRGLREAALGLEEEGARDRVVHRYGLDQGLPTVDLLDLFGGEVDETVHPYTYLDGVAWPTDIVLLRQLARRLPDCRYFEIGAWRGESLSNIASIASECVSLSLSADEMRRHGLSSAFIAQHNLFTSGLKNVESIGCDSTVFDFAPYAGRFDLVFVDGDHTYRGLLSDTQNAFRLLRGQSSVIVWHDAGRTVEGTSWAVLEAILDGCPDAESRSRVFRVSNTLCAIYSRDELPAAVMRTFPSVPNKLFELRLSARRFEPAGETDAGRPVMTP